MAGNREGGVVSRGLVWYPQIDVIYVIYVIRMKNGAVCTGTGGDREARVFFLMTWGVIDASSGRSLPGMRRAVVVAEGSEGWHARVEGMREWRQRQQPGIRVVRRDAQGHRERTGLCGHRGGQGHVHGRPYARRERSQVRHARSRALRGGRRRAVQGTHDGHARGRIASGRAGRVVGRRACRGLIQGDLFLISCVVC